jgi:epoxide hydrolase-like predicted phosphatase
MQSKPATRAVIWDMGGVLVRNLAAEPRQRLADAHGISEKQLEDLVFHNPVADQASEGAVPVEAVWEYVRADLHLDPGQLPGFMAAFWSSDRVDEELIDFIQSLRRHYKIGLLSNAFPDARQSLLTRFPRLPSVFDESIFSAEVKMVKPDPRIYYLILGRLGVAPEETVFVDDFSVNVEAARALGMTAIHFRTSPQARQAVLEALSIDGSE